MCGGIERRVKERNAILLRVIFKVELQFAEYSRVFVVSTVQVCATVDESYLTILATTTTLVVDYIILLCLCL